MLNINRYTYNTKDDSIWGPAFWFTIHNSSIHYPIQANSYYRENMKRFILSIPSLIPCDKCKLHASSYIQSHLYRLDMIVSGRIKLFKFFVDFHNDVNIRNNKPVYNYIDAYDLYSCEPL